MTEHNSAQDAKELQARLMDRLKSMTNRINLAPELMDLLGVGQDGAYRRIAGKTLLKFKEVVDIASHFHLSLDELVGDINPNAVTFLPSSLQQSQPGMIGYLKGLRDLMKTLRENDAQGIIIASKDIPTFQLFQFPVLLQFKMFFWRKTMFDDPTYKDLKFSPQIQSHERETINNLCSEIARMYSQLDSTEVWTAELAYGLVKQIRWYDELGQFENPEDSIQLVREGENMVNFLQKMAEEGRKLLISSPNFKGGRYELYRQDLIVNDNVISMIMNDQIRTFHVYNSIQYLQTGHQLYGEQVRSWLENLPKRSVAISTFNEKARVIFFNEIRDQLKKLRTELEQKYL